METRHTRLKKLERAVQPTEQEIRVFINWENDGLVTDYQTGERISESEWHKRFPDETLIVVRCDESLYDEDEGEGEE